MSGLHLLPHPLVTQTHELCVCVPAVATTLPLRMKSSRIIWLCVDHPRKLMLSSVSWAGCCEIGATVRDVHKWRTAEVVYRPSRLSWLGPAANHIESAAATDRRQWQVLHAPSSVPGVHDTLFTAREGLSIHGRGEQAAEESRAQNGTARREMNWEASRTRGKPTVSFASTRDDAVAHRTHPCAEDGGGSKRWRQPAENWVRSPDAPLVQSHGLDQVCQERGERPTPRARTTWTIALEDLVRERRLANDAQEPEPLRRRVGCAHGEAAGVGPLE